jgi:hypothetical protein
MTTPQQPNLAPPGAGLPRLELLVARILFALRRGVGSRLLTLGLRVSVDSFANLSANAIPRAGRNGCLSRGFPGLRTAVDIGQYG